MPHKKILFAVGGTGGHLFPAQGLAEELKSENDSLELLFAGAGLSTNAYFDKTQFRFSDICSTTPFRGSFLQVLKSAAILMKGIGESLRLLSQEKPTLVVGFGSFHAFPILCAAAMKKIPIVLFESNAIPGKVIRLFSKKALFTGIYFSEAKHHLKGSTVDVEIPMRSTHFSAALSKQQARSQLQLDPDLPTVLVFGGSQGAKGINHSILELLPRLSQEKCPIQLIHFTGNEETALEVSQLCQRLNIPCYAKKFEKHMHVAWSAADVAICRSGAMTLAELLHYEMPSILIPYPSAADQHQLKNALFVETQVKGAVHIVESSLSLDSLSAALLPLAAVDSPRSSAMKQAIADFKAQQKKAHLGTLIAEVLEKV